MLCGYSILYFRVIIVVSLDLPEKGETVISKEQTFSFFFVFIFSFFFEKCLRTEIKYILNFSGKNTSKLCRLISDLYVLQLNS